jgi:hypothetical protein
MLVFNLIFKEIYHRKVNLSEPVSGYGHGGFWRVVLTPAEASKTETIRPSCATWV